MIVASGYVLALGSMVHLEQQRSLGDGRLAGYLRSHDRRIAIRAELAIGRTKQPAGAGLLLKFANDPDTGKRAMAVYGLGLIAAQAASQSVLHALYDTSDQVLVSALDATNRLENAHIFTSGAEKRAADRTIALLRSADPVVRSRAATTLEAFSAGGQATRALAALSSAYSRETSPAVRWHEAWSVYRGFAKTAPLSLLKRELRDRDEIVRIEAVRAFGKRADAKQIALVRPLLGDRSWRVQEQAHETLTVLGGGKMTEHLKSLLAGLHLPARVRDPYANLKALPRTHHIGKFAPPSAGRIVTAPALAPDTVAQFTGAMPGPHPRMRIVTTQGNITVELYPEWAPLTVENFMNLANGGYYDGNPWFRIVPDFVVQSGDPSATAPGVGYSTVAEENPIEQDSYIIAMGLDYTNPPNAHAKRDSAGSEFYITLSPQLHLNSDFSVFGRMIGGFDVLPRLVESDKILRVERLPDSAR